MKIDRYIWAVTKDFEKKNASQTLLFVDIFCYTIKNRSLNTGLDGNLVLNIKSSCICLFWTLEGNIGHNWVSFTLEVYSTVADSQLAYKIYTKGHQYKHTSDHSVILITVVTGRVTGYQKRLDFTSCDRCSDLVWMSMPVPPWSTRGQQQQQVSHTLCVN